MNPPGKARFSWRALTSWCTTISFLIMAVTGVVIFLAPSTRIARDTRWQVWGLTKSEWIDLHLVFSTVFLVVAVIHLVFNWRPLIGYLRRRMAESVVWRWEWVAALVLCVLFFAGARMKAPPFSILLNWREKFHGGHCWQSESSSDHSPARGQGGFGQKTLAQYCAEQGLNLDTALACLQAKGVKARGTDTMRQIADKHGYERPSDILRLLQP